MTSDRHVFISHASEDKARFVVPFATALRNKGIEAWLDQWEILPGDSLVEKLFEEGLKNAAAVVIVISKYSVNKPWVREELNKAIVDKVAKKTKIIPILIDEVEVPEALKSTVWETVTDLSNIESALRRVINAIVDRREKPPLGELPQYLSQRSIAGLMAADTVTLRAVYDELISSDRDVVQPEVLLPIVAKQGLTTEMLGDSLRVLADNFYLEAKRMTSTGFASIAYVRPTHAGFLKYAGSFLPELDKWTDDIALKILNEKAKHNQEIARSLGLSNFVVDQILETFARNRWITLSGRSLNPHRIVMDVSPTMRRHYTKALN